MKRPIARPTASPETRPEIPRVPRAFVPETVDIVEAPEDAVEQAEAALLEPAPAGRSMGWLGRIAWGAGGILVSLGLGLAGERLVSDLFQRYPPLGWLGLVVLLVLILALFVLALREIGSVSRLKSMDRLRLRAGAAVLSDKGDEGRGVLQALNGFYGVRADLAQARAGLDKDLRDVFDGAEMVRLAERRLMSPLDARARAMTAAAARRVALVTAVSPRALVDVAFVAYESIRLGGAIATLYGAKPGFLGFWRLAGSVLGHLAVTGGLALGDGLIEQLVGQGLAARVSSRLGEGVVNGLMTVRVGIAAMRVVRPLPFTIEPQPMVKDFLPELMTVTQKS
jgi:putative membrane protein